MHKDLRSNQKQFETFFCGIFKIGKIKEKICGFGGGNKSKFVATLALIPYDVAGWPDLHGFEAGKRMNTKNTVVETKNTSGKRANRGDNSRSLQGRITRQQTPNGVASGSQNPSQQHA